MHELLDNDTLYALLDEIKAEQPMASRLGELKALVNKVAAWERRRCSVIVEELATNVVDEQAKDVLQRAGTAILDRDKLPLTSDVYWKESGRGLS